MYRSFGTFILIHVCTSYRCTYMPLSRGVSLPLIVVETNNLQHMLFKKNCSISISCAMWGSVACKHKARQGLHQPAGRPVGRPAKGPRIGGDPPLPPPPPPPWSLSLRKFPDSWVMQLTTHMLTWTMSNKFEVSSPQE